MSVSRPILLAALGLLVVLATWFVFSGPGETPPPLEPLTPTTSTEAEDGEGAISEVEATAPSMPEAGRVEIDEAPTTPEASALTRDVDLRLTVLDPDGAPLPGAELMILATAEDFDLEVLALVDWENTSGGRTQLVGTAASQSDGVLTTRVPAETPLALRLHAAGMASLVALRVSPASGELMDLGQVQLDGGRSLVVEVQTVSGEPVPEARVVAFAQEYMMLSWEDDYDPAAFQVSPSQVAWTDQGGRAVIMDLPDVPSDEVEVWGERINDPWRVEELGPEDDPLAHRRFVIGEARTLAGRVIDAAGQPMAGVQIAIMDPATSRSFFEELDRTELEEIVNEYPGFGWGLEGGYLQAFMQGRTDAEGRYTHEYHLADVPAGTPLYYAVIAVIDHRILVESKWTPADQSFELVTPALGGVRGRVVGGDGQPVPEAQLRFGTRWDLQEDADFQGVHVLEDSNLDLAADGRFDRQLIPGNYWAQVEFPGGVHLFEGPYTVTQETLDLGELVVPSGRRVTIQVIPPEGVSDLAKLAGLRMSAEELEDDDDSFFSLPEPPPATDDWQDFDEHLGANLLAAARKGLVLSWHQEPEGTFFYTVSADGCVPFRVELTHGPGSGDQTIDAPLEACGDVLARFITATGEAPTDVLAQLRPQGEAHPLYGWHRDQQEDADFLMFGGDHQTLELDETGVALFSNVIPGVYEIIAVQRGDVDPFGFSSDDQPVLATVEVIGGQEVEVECSLASMAELKLLVTRHGQPVANAEVATMRFPGFMLNQGFTMDLARRQLDALGMFDREEAGSTDAGGQLTLASMVPGAVYVVAARATPSSEAFDGAPWTIELVQLVEGVQEFALPLAVGGVRVRVAGFGDRWGHIQLCLVEPLVQDATTEADEHDHFTDWLANEGLYDRLRRQERASLDIEGDGNFVFEGVPPGRYRVLVEDYDDQVRGLSEVFTVDGALVEPPTIQVQTLGRVQIKILGMDALEEEARWDLDWRCLREDGSAVLSSMWIGDGSTRLSLEPGRYVLEVSNGGSKATSPPFDVLADNTTEFGWTLPDLDDEQ